MNTLLLINTHSFVSLITNSSSELFVLDTQKTLKMVKSLLQQAADNFSKTNRSEWFNPKELFSAHLKEPTINQIEFDIKKYPDAWEYQRIHNWRNQETHSIYAKAELEHQRFCENNRVDYPKNPFDYKTQKEEYNKYQNKFWNSREFKENQELIKNNRDELFKEWKELEESSQTALLKWAFEQNGLTYNIPPMPWPYDSKERKTWERKNRKALGLRAEINSAISYGYSLKKGGITVQTQGDNTCPYEFLDVISNLFTCQQIHLG